MASTETTPFGSGGVDLVERVIDVVIIGLSLSGAEAVSEVVMEGVVCVVVFKVVLRLGTLGSEAVGVSVTVVESSVSGAGLTMVVRELVVRISVVEALASGVAGSLLRSATFVDVVAAAAELKSGHISVLEGDTVLEGEVVKLVESGTEFEIVRVGVVAVRVVAAGVHGAALGLCFGGVFVPPSCIWASSFSGVLRPDVVGGGPGLRTGFGSKAGFPADSCADTLARI